VEKGQLPKHVFVGILLAILLVSTLPIVHNIIPGEVNAKSETVLKLNSNPQNMETGFQNEWETPDSELETGSTPMKLDLNSEDDLRRFAWEENDLVRLVVGVDASCYQIENLENAVSKEGGRVIDKVTMGESVSALAVEVPISEAGVFADRIRANSMVEYVEADLRMQAFFTPNDANWTVQWGPQKIEADWAWNTTTGSSDILVAIIDTGVDYTHPDLTPNYVPLGYDWVNDDTDPIDDFGHGSHCAGIVAAALNNGVGIAGLAQVRVMSEKVLDSYGTGASTWIAQGIIHATDQGAKIISMSLGTYFEPEEPDVLHDAVKYAYNHSVLIVAAAGNSGFAMKGWPAAYDEVVAVTATDSDDQLAFFSSYGDWVELSAPGVDIYSTMPTYHVTMNDYGYSMNYADMSGTSMACPHVVGVAALIWSQFPNFTRDEVRSQLRNSADDLQPLGYDSFFGYGRVNARMAVAGIPEHDIRINGWEYLRRILPGQATLFNTSILNSGKKNETNIIVQLLVNDTIASSKNIDFLQNNTSTTVSFPWNTTTVGTYNITCYAVPVPGENYTANNVASTNLLVGFPTTLTVPDEFLTIQEALDQTISGDTVFVRSGIYDESVSVKTDLITILGENKSTTVIETSGPIGVNINAKNVTLSGFTIKDAYFYGVLVYYPQDVPTGDIISDNIITGNYFAGISIERGGNTLRNNTFYNNEGTDIYIHGSERTYFQDIDASNKVNGKPVYYCLDAENMEIPLDAGYIALVNCENVTARNLNLTESGLVVAYSNNITIAGCTVSMNFPQGIQVKGSENVTLKENTVASNKGYGIKAEGSSYIEIIGNVVVNNDNEGIMLSATTYSTVTSNNVSSNDCGISIEYGGSNVLQNNTIENDSHGAEGVKLLNTTSNTLANNRFLGNQHHLEVYGSTLSHYIQNIEVTNTVKGKPIYYLVNEDNLLLDGLTTAVGYVAVINSSKITIRNVKINEGGHVLLIAFSTNVTVTQSVFVNDYCVVHLFESNFCNFTRNALFKVRLEYSTHNIFQSNVISGDPALYLSFSHNNTFEENNIQPPHPSWLSTNVELHDSTQNLFALNNFIVIEPPNGIHIASTDSTNTWDNGTRGNYWSQYSGEDQNGDGVGDTPYFTGESDKDNYPLMNPWAITKLTITKIETSKTVIGQGFAATISITIENQGDLTETFNVEACVNSIIIGTQTNMILAGGNSTIVDFTWNTSSFAKGNYTISASITPVPGEAPIHGLATVTIPGDVNGDFDVDLYDVVSICAAYNSKIGEPKYVSNYDINGDGKINLYDVVIACAHYGQKYP
jgi:thermitase